MLELSEAEGRVLGCLVEKERTTPQGYPLTDAALVTACNQTTGRDPVVQYDTATVRLAVRSLRERGLLRTVHRSGERTDKHRHELEQALGLDPAQTALLAVLLLRGPQTVGELRARSERLHPVTAAEVEAALEALAGRDEPLVARLDRQPGRKEHRYAQLLVPDLERPAGTGQAVPGGPEHGPPPAPAVGSAASAPAREDPGPQMAELRADVAALAAEVAALRAEVGRLGAERAQASTGARPDPVTGADASSTRPAARGAH